MSRLFENLKDIFLIVFVSIVLSILVTGIIIGLLYFTLILIGFDNVECNIFGCFTSSISTESVTNIIENRHFNSSSVTHIQQKCYYNGVPMNCTGLCESNNFFECQELAIENQKEVMKNE